MSSALRSLLLSKTSFSPICILTRMVHMPQEPKGYLETHKQKWIKKNEIVYPPQEPGEERRPAWVCHQRTQIKYSPDKLLLVASNIRGLSVDEAIKQTSFMTNKGAQIIKEVLLEAQELAVKEHNVQYKTNLWVSHALVGRGVVVKGVRKHARMRFGEVRYKFCHFFVCLEEGSPPESYYPLEPTGNEKLEEFIANLRNRTIVGSL